MSVLVLTLKAPLQSWGVGSRGIVRDSGEVPSKSGVVGLLGAALGRGRDEDFSDLSALTMCVRVEERGQVWSDFQTVDFRKKAYPVTAAAMRCPDDKEFERSRSQKALLTKKYLSGAHFTVFLEGEAGLLGALRDALRSPVYPLYLGRKNCVPQVPVFTALLEGDVSAVEAAHTWESELTGSPAGKALFADSDPAAGGVYWVRDARVGDHKFTGRAVASTTVPGGSDDFFGLL